MYGRPTGGVDSRLSSTLRRVVERALLSDETRALLSPNAVLGRAGVYSRDAALLRCDTSMPADGLVFASAE